MCKGKLINLFEGIKKEANLAYAIINTDEYGDCNTCVNDSLTDEFGIDSKGIYLKHWLTGMNAGPDISELNLVFVGHDLEETEAALFISICEQEGYKVSPSKYDPKVSFTLEERG